MKNAIVLCSDSNYLLHASALFGSLSRQEISNNADLILISDSSLSEDKLQVYCKRGIKVVLVNNSDHGYYLKYNIFNKDFSVYDNILYLDIDMAIVRDGVDVFSDFKDDIEVDFEPFSLHQTMISAAPKLTDDQIRLLSTIPDRKAWNSGGILFKGKILDDSLANRMYDARNRYKEINYHVRGVMDGGDQPIFNIVLDRYEPKQSSLFSYWKRRNESTVFAHCCADTKDRPWNNPEFIDNYRMGLNFFEKM